MATLTKVFSISDKILATSMRVVIIAVIILATGTMFLQVITRYVFQISVSGLDELAGHTAVWLYAMGAAYGAYDRSHIKANMLHLFIANKKILAAVDMLSMVIAIVVSGFMTVWSFKYVEWSIKKHEVTPTLQLPTVIFQSAILVGAVLMVIYFSVELVAKIQSLPDQQNENNYQNLPEES
jgi:TRAP-type C4-dicarboxylate transport system permease small subunit